MSGDPKKARSELCKGRGEERVQAEERASVKALRWDQAWCVRGTTGDQCGWRGGKKGR